MIYTKSRIINIFSSFFKLYKEREIPTLSASLSYYILFASFPAMAVIGIVTEALFNSSTNIVFYEYLPKSVADFLCFENHPNTAVTFGSVLVSVFSIVKFIRVLKHHLDTVNGDHGNYWSSWLFSSIMAAYFLFILYLSVFSLVFGENVLKFFASAIGHGNMLVFVWNKLRLILTSVLIMFFLMLVFRFLPEKKQDFKSCIPGAVFTAAVWLASASAFSVYVEHLSNHSALYGSLSAFVVLMLWFYLLSNIILSGFCISLVFSCEKSG